MIMNYRGIYHRRYVFVLLLLVAVVNISYGWTVLKNKDYKRRYLSPSGVEKVRKYLSRKYVASRNNTQTFKKHYFSNTWAVHIDPPDNDVADRIAKKHGFTNIGKIGNIEGHYHFKHEEIGERELEKARHKTALLNLEDEVKFAEQQKILERVKRDGIPNDPYFKDMWYLLNTGQASGPAGVDMNVVPVWKKNITGRGIVISVLDDGLDWTHPDLEANYDQTASIDLNDNDNDPMPRDSDADNCHGTRCAGEAAAIANNGICGTGVAYNAKIGGVRMLDGQATDALEASALGFRGDHIDIYINCWGPKDDGKTFGKPGPMAAKALRLGAEQGRNRLGSIFVWATGNGGLTDDDCNCDGYTTSIFTISIGCIGDHGLSAYYTEKCSSTLAVTFNGASHKEGRENKMVTTDLYHQCTEEFKGTSASAPLAAGIIALTLEANPLLTWRDVQALIVQTAQITSPVDEGWKRNGAGYHYNHKFGFGRLDAEAMVNAALTWVNLPQQRKCTAAAGFDHQDIPKGDSLLIKIQTTEYGCSLNPITKLEHVILTVSFVHRRRGDVSIDLVSPNGTKSEMLSPRRYDDSDEGLDEWNFMTVYNWGENPNGVWLLRVTDNPNQDDAMSFFNSEANDVESLEEQVIDTQTKQNKEIWEKMRLINPNFDVPYPTGVRKNNVATKYKDNANIQNIAAYKNGNVEPITDKIEYDRSDIPEVSSEEKENEIENKISDKTNKQYDEYVVPVKKGNLAVFDEKFQNVPDKNENDESKLNDSDDDVVREKKDLLSEEKKEILNFYNQLRSKRKKFNTRSAQNDGKISKKVQVQEETGTQRVQVNAGYENPRISCESGRNDCSGVLLKFSLTFYGTV
ncbi:PC3-like endoprotease variant B isoform X2 [Hydra vulgaris]|uniref:PC3-like endoprotease variant B isoform X2 n=2 Tax=Hydra vulgaris TaxID=6087 RepID=A0ABM4BKZ8_HYDVU